MIPRSGRSPGERNGNPLQYSCLGNPMDRGAWWTTWGHNESVLCIRLPKYGSFSFSINPSSEYSGFISFRIDWFDLLAVQGNLKSLLQHHSSKVIYSLVLSFLYGPTLTSILDGPLSVMSCLSFLICCLALS